MVLEEIIKEAKEADVQKILGVGMSIMSQARILEITDRFDSIYPALGIHPQEVAENPNLKSQLEESVNLIKNNKDKLCAIGEIGLDHHFVKDKSLYPLQNDVFKKMLSLAQEFTLPVNLHVKGAEREVFDVLSSYKLPNVNIHWYSGPENILKEGIDRGYYFSITPAIKYSPPMKKVVELVDIEHLLLESDGPVKYEGVTGVPAMIRSVLNRISKLKNISTNDLEQQIEKNTQAIFPKMF